MNVIAVIHVIYTYCFLIKKDKTENWVIDIVVIKW